MSTSTVKPKPRIPGARWLVGILLAAVLLYLFLRSADWSAVVASMKAANPLLLAACVLLQPPLFLLRALRWQCFMAPIKRISIKPLLSAMMIGFMVSFIFPGRLGEIVRPVLIGIREKVSKTSAFATIVIERIFDMLAVLVLLQVYFALSTLIPGAGGIAGSQETLLTVRKFGFLALLGTLAVIFAMILLKLKQELAIRIFSRLASVLPSSLKKKALHMLEAFTAGLNVYHDAKTFVLIGFYSLAIWAGICLSIWICIRAFGIDIPYILIFPIQAILLVGVAIPTPGMVGGFHATMKVGLVNMCGVETNLAVSATIVLHALLVIPAILQGLYHAWQEGFSIGEVRNLGESEKDLEAAG